MDGPSPAERPIANHRQRPEAEGGRPAAEPLPPEGAEWLTEFLHREGAAPNRTVAEPDGQWPEPAAKSYRGRGLIGWGVLLAAGFLAAGLLVGGLTGALGPHNLKIDQYAHRAEAWAAGLRMPEFGHPSAPASLALGGPAAPRPADKLHPATPYPATAEVRSSASVPQPPERPLRAAPAFAMALPAAPPVSDTLPDGTPLHLRIVYAPASPAEGVRMDALADRLRRQSTEVASATASAGATPEEAVVYFFPDDAVGALRIAASLSRITNRPEPVALVHADALPRPGTIEIRLPLKVAKDLSNEGT